MIAGFIARVRSLWRGLRWRSDVEAEMTEEFRLHLELRTEDLIRQGLRPEEAAHRARIEFGHIRSHREDARDARGLRLFDLISFSWLDVKLGLRMVAKYPGLSLVAVIGMSVAIAIGAGAFGVISSMLDPTLPLPEGERVVAIQNTNIRTGGQDRRSLHDFLLWRAHLQSVHDLSAYMSARRNLVIPGRGVELVRVAQMTASGFRVARVAPVLGRPLLDEDEHERAPPVVVIAYEEWQRHFDGDPAIVGRPVRFGDAVHTVVGVMPEGFRFPVNHRYWVPLRLNPADFEPGGDPSISMFGRLSGGLTLDQAQAELTAMGLRMAATHPRTHENLRPQVLPYAHPYFDIDSPRIALFWHAVRLAIGLLLVVVAANVAILVYARTATRMGEIAVRTALGASRGRVVAQLFAEALVLSGIATVLGLTVAGAALTKIQNFAVASGADFPFWWSLGLSPGLVAYVVGLALVAGVIAGVLPALKATGRRVQAGLQQLSSRGSHMQLGRTWTGLIVTQVALAVAVLPIAIHLAAKAVGRGMMEPGYRPEQFLRASLSMEREESVPDAEAADRFRSRTAELLRRLEAEPAVAGVAFASHFPGGGDRDRIEVEDAGTTDAVGGWVWTNRVDADLFAVFDVPILSGRGFGEVDAREGSSAVIVDRVLVEQVFGGGNVLGRRVRLVPATSAADTGSVEAGPWLEIVGVVPDFTIPFDGPKAMLYQPVALPQLSTVVSLAIRVRAEPASTFAGRLRNIAAEVDPDLQLHGLRSAADAQRQSQQFLRYLALGIVTATLSVLLLSAAGIYAMMSFTVARRRREIGIRSALGADPRHILSSIFARAASQLGAGVLGGLVLATAVGRAAGVVLLSGSGVVLLSIVTALMLAIGLLAALGPARQGLRIQPTEALKEE